MAHIFNFTGQNIGIPHDGTDRRAEFVRHIRQERAFSPVT